MDSKSSGEICSLPRREFDCGIISVALRAVVMELSVQTVGVESIDILNHDTGVPCTYHLLFMRLSI